MESLVATNVILLFVAVIGWSGFFTLAYAIFGRENKRRQDNGRENKLLRLQVSKWMHHSPLSEMRAT